MLANAESIKIHGQYIPVRAEVDIVNNLSAHADQGEILKWLSHFRNPPKTTFITHGEPEAAQALREKSKALSVGIAESLNVLRRQSSYDTHMKSCSYIFRIHPYLIIDSVLKNG